MATAKKTAKKTAKSATKSSKKSTKAAKTPPKASPKKSLQKKGTSTSAKKKTSKAVIKKQTKRALPLKKAVNSAPKKKIAERKPIEQKPQQEKIQQQESLQPAENIQTAQEPKKGADKYSIDVVEGPENRYFVLTVNNYRNFFALEEMRHIVKACHQSSGEQEGMQRLYHWFKNFRQDVINNTKIEGPSDPALATIYNYIVSTYTVKGS